VKAKLILLARCTAYYNLIVYLSCFSTKQSTQEKNLRQDMTIIRIILEPLAFLATAAIMPLAFLAFFGTYAWICFTGEKYCGDTTADNEIQKDRNLIIFGFMVCASILLFSSKMMKSPEKAKDRCDWCCITS